MLQSHFRLRVPFILGRVDIVVALPNLVTVARCQIGRDRHHVVSKRIPASNAARENTRNRAIGYKSSNSSTVQRVLLPPGAYKLLLLRYRRAAI